MSLPIPDDFNRHFRSVFISHLTGRPKEECSEVNEPVLGKIDAWVMGQFKLLGHPGRYGITPGTIEARAFLMGHDPESGFDRHLDLYLRFNAHPGLGWPHRTLVIAKIAFPEKRKGHGTNFLRLATKLAVDNDLHHIGIESTNEESSAFANHFGFVQREPSTDSNNYVISTERLLQHPKIRGDSKETTDSR